MFLWGAVDLNTELRKILSEYNFSVHSVSDKIRFLFLLSLCFVLCSSFWPIWRMTSSAVSYTKLYLCLSAFSPTVVSTPYAQVHVSGSPQQNLSLSTTEPNIGTGSMHYSHRHNGLYLYVGRIVLPLWNLRVVTKATLDKVQFVSMH
jgi:hypothetical protein